MNIGICDDNIEYIRDIEEHVEFYFKDKDLSYKLYTFTSGEGLLNSGIIYDIVFLDIELGKINGLDIGKELKKKNESTVFIIVTAYSSYLDDAMNLQVLRFLDKPLHAPRLYSGLDRAIELIDSTTVSIYLKDEDCNKKIPIKSIVFCEAELRKTKIVTTDGIFHSSEKLSWWEGKLTASFFASPHKSYVVNMDKIVEFSRNYVILKGIEKYTISIASKKQTDFKRKIAQFMETRR